MYYEKYIFFNKWNQLYTTINLLPPSWSNDIHMLKLINDWRVLWSENHNYGDYSVSELAECVDTIC